MGRASRSSITSGTILVLAIAAATGVYLRSGQEASMQEAAHCDMDMSKVETMSPRLERPLAVNAPLGPVVYTGTLSGAAENPPVASAGTGSATVTIDTVAHTLRVQVTFSGLNSGTTASHIHCCAAAAGLTTGVATTTPTFTGFPSGVTSGTYDQTFDTTNASTYNPAFVTAQGSIASAEAALASGLLHYQAYLNIHTSTSPGGEIRAILTPPGVTIRSGTGTTNADATLLAARDAFRTDLGGGTVAGANGSFGGLRREINWDGVPAASSAPNNMAANFFNTTSPRGVVFSTPGTGFQVSGAITDEGAGQPAAANFGNIDPSYTTTFSTFSAQRLFTTLGSNIVDVNFFVPGGTNASASRGFGAIFSDVDTSGPTTITYFDTSNSALGTFAVAPQAGNATFSFLGVSFGSKIVGRVRIVSGNGALAAGVDDGATDLVVMDDFIYGEPAAPLAAGVSVSGRVLSPDGRGLRAARVTITDGSGESRSVPTGARGAFTFTEVEVGQTYIVSVASRRYAYDPIVLSVNDNVTGLELIAGPGR